MASHGANWVLGMHMRFGSLDFIASTEGRLTWVNGPATPFWAISLEEVTETLRELRLYALGTYDPGSNQCLSAANIEFVGMMDYVSESFYDLVMEGSKIVSDSNSYGGSYHPSHECFMVEIQEEPSEGTHGREATPSVG